MSDSGTAEFLLSLARNDIKLWLEEGQLRVNAPKGVLVGELKAELVDRKSELIAYLERLSAGEEGSDVIPVVSAVATDDTLFPLSFAQERFWYLYELYPEAATYHVQEVMPVECSADIIVSALKALAERHSILRTTYHRQGSAPFQRVNAELPLLFSSAELHASSVDELPPEILAHTQDELRKTFDLAEGPVWRARLLTRNQEAYRLILTVHHIATDGRSMELLERDFSATCRAMISGVPPSPAAPTLQYVDYAAWQREWMSGGLLRRELDYWLGRLSDAPHQIDLRFDHPRTVADGNDCRLHVVSIGEGELEKLRELVSKNQATLFMALLTVFNLMLSRYTRQEDILIGTPVADRERSETEDLVGLFMNTLVLRTAVCGDNSFLELLQSVKIATLEAFEHRQLPFEKLIEALKPERESNVNPVYQVMFNYLHAQDSGKDELFSGDDISDIGAAQVDLSLFVQEKASKLVFGFAYNAALFEADTISRMADHFLNLLQNAVKTPESPMGSLPLLNDAAAQEILEDWNATSVDYPAHVCLHQMFEDQVQKTPDAIALVYEDERLTYGELKQRVDQLANYLRGRGVGPETVVGVLAERSLEMVIGLYGILKAGGAYLPLDPDLPRERVRFMLEEAGVQLVLTQQHLGQGKNNDLAGAICLDSDWEMIASARKAVSPEAVTQDNLAYIIYTSGSTGKPKGVMNCHSGIVNRIQWMQSRYQLTPNDAVLQKTPFSFDVSVWEFFWPLMAGARLVIARPGGHKDPRYLSQLVSEERITTLHFVPSMLKAFLEHGELDQVSTIRTVICSGEALPYELQQQFFRGIDAELHNLYGPTEAAVDVTSWACRCDADKTVVPIGKPIANTSIYILDPAMQPVPIGVAGELHIGGVQVARGYVNREDLTAERFIANPFSQDTTARLYRTGDLARYMPDGNIEYLGRLDHQVKLRGFRIELGEIEAALEEHPDIAIAAAVVREDAKAEQRLLSYVEAVDARQIDVAAIRESMRQQLPDYMVPAAVVQLDAIPLTGSGKIDRKALPAHDFRPERKSGNSSLPASDYERIMAQIWEELLDIDGVYVFDTFFDLGGHSLLTLEVVSQFEEATGKRLNPADLVTRTLRQLTSGLDAPATGESKFSQARG